MTTILFLCGLYAFGLALFHLFFPKIFNWKNDLKKITFANRAIIQILNVQIIFYFIFVGAICFLFPSELITTKFGRFFLAGNSLFWLTRTIQQFIFLRMNHYKIHLLTFLFFLGAFLFALPLILR